MRKVFAFALSALMLTASLALLPQQRVAAQGPGLVSSILNKMDANRRSLRSLRAAVTMQKYNSQIKSYEMAQGEAQYVPGKGRDVSVRVDWSRPAREHLAVSGGQYTLFRPRLNQAYKGSVRNAKGSGKAGNVLGFALGASGAQLKSQYNVELAGDGILYDGGPHVWMLKLTPKTGADFKFAEIWVDDSGMPVQARITERNNDSTLVRLTGIQRNAGISRDAFEIQLPAGVKIVKG
jgi:outer membrane lipoprotein-sorting protein